MSSFMSIKKIYTVSPRGFCAGVQRAVDMLEYVLKKHVPPIYMKHQIVHNRRVVEGFQKRGVAFVERLEDIPPGSVVVFSAHGNPPESYRIAKERELIVYDAVCPLVTKVHREARRYEQEGYFIFYIGHKGHVETVGVMGEVRPTSIALIETKRDVEPVRPAQTEKLMLLTQTTLSFDETEDIVAFLKQKYPNLTKPPAFDICYASQNRQHAVKELAKRVELVFVVGSPESSNSNRLRDVAQKSGARAYLINDVSDINKEWLKGIEVVGITAGASAEEAVVQEVAACLGKGSICVEELPVIKEHIRFPLPKEMVNV